MSKSSDESKSKQLGMPHGTAMYQLRKLILFDCVQRLGFNVCFQCGEEIETPRELSIEHKTPWLHSDEPLELFFDLDNVTFSHLSCNCSAGRGSRRKVKRSDGVTYDSIKEASEDTGAGEVEICRICRGVGKTAAGYGWEYA